MNEDNILQMFFEPERWRYAIGRAFDKGISKSLLYQLTKPETRLRVYEAVVTGKYTIAPPHIALIPKDDGTMRTVYVNEPLDRIFLAIANDLLFELMPEMVHKSCKSYQKGIGCGKVVIEASERIGAGKGVMGWKSDLSKYFDSVPIQYIDEVFDKVEAKCGKSRIIEILRTYYHTDIYIDLDNNVQVGYQSLKQGCSVASFLADAVIYHIDDKLSSLGGQYVRYSDDMLFVGERYEEAMRILSDELAKMQMKLNPKKVEYLDRDHWFKFLGFSIKGNERSLSKTRIKTFQKEIEHRTIKNRKVSFAKAVNDVNRYLYKGFEGFSWATSVLPVINVRKDINTLNIFTMDCLRAVQTGKRRVGGLGYVKDQKEGCIQRGIGRNVTANRKKTDTRIKGYYTIGCMQNALMTRRAVFNTLVANL